MIRLHENMEIMLSGLYVPPPPPRSRVGKNPGFFKKTQPGGFFWVLLGFFGFYWVLLGFFGFYWVFLKLRAHDMKFFSHIIAFKCSPLHLSKLPLKY